MKLLRICECSEMLIRFLAVASLSKIHRTTPNQKLSDSLKQVLLGKTKGTQGLSMPSFGDWLEILSASLNELAPERLVLTNLGDFSHRAIGLIDPKPNPSMEDSVYQLRNGLAHDGRFSVERANYFLKKQGHEKRFKTFWEEENTHSFFSGFEIWGAVNDSSAILLQNSEPCLKQSPSYPLNDILTSQSVTSNIPDGSIFLKNHQGDFLLLYPLFLIGKIHQKTGGTIQPITDDAATQAYCRQGRDGLEYTAFHSFLGRSLATRKLHEDFKSLFPLGKWREDQEEQKRESIEAKSLHEQLRKEFKSRQYDFRDIVKYCGGFQTVERKEETHTLLKWLDGNQSGCGLVLGKPGMGKSTLAVNLYVALCKKHKDWLILRYFFVSGDPRNSLRDFMLSISMQLQFHGASERELPVNIDGAKIEFLNMLDSFVRESIDSAKKIEKVVLLLDGVDEIGLISYEFFKLIKSIKLDRVLCLCFARPSQSVFDGLSSEQVEWIFGKEGLQPLKRENVRQFFMENLDRRIYEFLKFESDEGNSKFLDEITESSRSLPLYLQLLLRDLLNDEYDFRRPDKIPRSLDDYYTKLIAQTGMDPARMILPQIIALVSIAHLPLTENMLKNLLQNEALSQDAEWDEMVNNALQIGNMMLRKTTVFIELTGFTVYHHSLRNYFLVNEEKPYADSIVSPLMRLARKQIHMFCSNWKDWAQNSPERQYAIRFYPKHLLESENWSELAELLTDLFYLEERIQIDPIPELTHDIKSLCAHIPKESTRLFLEQFAVVLDQYVDFLSKHPKSLFQCAWNSLRKKEVVVDSEEQGGLSKAAILEHWKNEMYSRKRYWLRTLQPQSETDLRPQLFGGGGLLYGKAISRDGKLFAKVDLYGDMKEIFTHHKDERGIFIWRTSGQLLFKIPFCDFGPCIPIAFGKDGKFFLAGKDSSIQVWDVVRGERIKSLKIPGSIVAATSAHGNLPLRVLTNDGYLHSWDEFKNTWDHKRLPISDPILTGEIAPNGEGYFVITKTKCAIFIKDTADVRTQTLPAGMNLFPNLHASQKGIFCNSGANEHHNGFPDIEQFGMPLTPGELGFLEMVFPGNDIKSFLNTYGMLINPLVSCSFASSSLALLYAIEPKIDEQERYGIVEKTGVSLWSMTSPSEIHKFSWPGVACTSTGFSTDGGYFAVGLSSGQTRLFEQNTLDKSKCLESVVGPVSSLLFLPGGEKVIIAGSSARVQKTSDVNAAHCEIQPHNKRITASACSKDGAYFATGDEEGGIAIWETTSGHLKDLNVPRVGHLKQNENGKLTETDDNSTPFTFKTGHTRAITSLFFLPDNSHLISVSKDGEWWFWETNGLIPRHSDELDSDVDVWPLNVWAALSDNGNRLALMTGSGEASVWAIDQNFELVFRRNLGNRNPAGLAISSDGEYVAIASYLAQPEEGSSLTTFSDHSIEVISLLSGEFQLSFPLPFHMEVAMAFLKAPLSPPHKGKETDEGLKRYIDLWKSLPQPNKLNDFLLKNGISLGDEGQIFAYHLIAYCDSGTGYARVLRTESHAIEFPERLPGFGYVRITAATESAVFCAERDGYTLRSDFPDNFDIIEGEGDLKAIAEGAKRYPYSILKRDRESATVIEASGIGRKIAWYHVPLSNLSIQSDTRTMIGSFGSEVHILRIEAPDNNVS